MTQDENTTGGRTPGEGVKFERIRRITGYLVGTLDRFNNAKRAEEHDRVKHSPAKFPVGIGGNAHGAN